MIIVRLFIFLYMGGVSFIVLHSLSELVFGTLPIKERFKSSLKKMIFAPLYPLSLLSRNGRKKFINKLKGI